VLVFYTIQWFKVK